MPSATSVVARAKSAIGNSTKYKLGQGGFGPRLPYPWSAKGECDCSGFLAWCIEISRQTDNPWYRKQNGGWLETSAIVRDAQSPFGFFDEVAWTAATPGMVVVYGDSKDANGRVRQGHVGIISAVDATGPTHVIHCSKGNASKGGDAIQETPVGPIFTPIKAIAARCAFVR